MQADINANIGKRDRVVYRTTDQCRHDFEPPQQLLAGSRKKHFVAKDVIYREGERVDDLIPVNVPATVGQWNLPVLGATLVSGAQTVIGFTERTR